MKVDYKIISFLLRGKRVTIEALRTLFYTHILACNRERSLNDLLLLFLEQIKVGKIAYLIDDDLFNRTDEGGKHYMSDIFSEIDANTTSVLQTMYNYQKFREKSRIAYFL